MAAADRFCVQSRFTQKCFQIFLVAQRVCHSRDSEIRLYFVSGSRPTNAANPVSPVPEAAVAQALVLQSRSHGSLTNAVQCGEAEPHNRCTVVVRHCGH